LLGGIFEPEKINSQIQSLEQITSNPDFWQDQDRAKKIMQEKTALENSLKNFNFILSELADNKDLLEIAEDNDLQQIYNNLQKLHESAHQCKIECIFSSKEDKMDCFLEINTGVGGNDASDFSSMLMRMYLRWAESHNFKTEIIHFLDDESGIKSATIKISGINAFGWAKTESGVHRLVRISPFNSNGKRQTSFSSIWVYPAVEDDIEIIVEDKDIRIDTYRASGAGGQHVNKTDSAVRITHLPTKIVAQCQNDRSQIRNKAEAMKILKSRLYEFEMRRRQEEEDKKNSVKTDNGWGHQIRSYVLHPYQMVKDLRSNIEKGNCQAVFDGDIDDFIKSNLSRK
jgi:peptide chain release factor 2